MVRAALFLEYSVAGVEGGGEDGDEDEDAVLYSLQFCCCIHVADPLEMLDTTVTSLLLWSMVGICCSRAKQHQTME